MTIVDFVIAKDFRTPRPMPDWRRNRVAVGDTAAIGEVECYTRNKGWLRDVVSSQTERRMILTGGGILLLWMKPEQGFAIRLSTARSCTTKTRKAGISGSGTWHFVCRMKVHFSFGTLNIFLAEGAIAKWRDPLIHAAEGRALVVLQVPSEHFEAKPIVTLPVTDDECSDLEQASSPAAEFIGGGSYIERVESPLAILPLPLEEPSAGSVVPWVPDVKEEKELPSIPAPPPAIAASRFARYTGEDSDLPPAWLREHIENRVRSRGPSPLSSLRPPRKQDLKRRLTRRFSRSPSEHKRSVRETRIFEFSELNDETL